MNRYGRLVESRYRTHAPARYAAITDPTSFFSTLGEQLESQIQELAEQLAGPDLPGEDYLTKVGRLNMARLQAEELVLSEQVPGPSPTQELEEEELEDDGEPSRDRSADDPLLRVMAAHREMDRARLDDETG